MEEMGQCPNCGQNKVANKTQRDGSVIPICDFCGSRFPDPQTQQGNARRPGLQMNGIFGIFENINKFAAVLAILAIVISILAAAGLNTANSNISILETNLITTKASLEEQDTLIDGAINTLEGSVTDNAGAITLLGTDQASLTSRVDIQDTEIDSVQESLILNQETLDSVNETINSLQQYQNAEFALMTNTTTSIIFDSYPNQSNTTTNRYCHLSIDISNTNDDIRESLVSLSYPDTSITLIDWTSTFEPQIHTYSPSSLLIGWFEKSSNLYAQFNVTWDISNYNITSLPLGTLDENLMINGFYVNFDNVTEVVNA